MEPILNLPELLERVDHDREILRDLVLTFQEELPRQLKEIREAVAREDVETVAKVGHTLKGMLSNVSAARAAVGAELLEQLGRQGGKQGLKDALAQFELDTAALLAELNARLMETRV